MIATTCEGDESYACHSALSITLKYVHFGVFKVYSVSPMLLKSHLLGKTVSLQSKVEVNINGVCMEFLVEKVVFGGCNYKYVLGKYFDDAVICISTQILIENNYESTTAANSKLSTSFILHSLCSKSVVDPMLIKLNMLYSNSKYSSLILAGDSGSGKSILVDAISEHFHMRIIWIKAYELFLGTSIHEQDSGGGEYASQKWIHLCNEIISSQRPSILCIDDMENVCLGTKLLQGDEIYQSVHEVSEM